MTDQHRKAALGCYGDPVIQTPNIDRLAEGGVLCEQCWTQHPICMPARASIFTGRYPQAHGVRHCGVDLPLDEITMAQVKRQLQDELMERIIKARDPLPVRTHPY